MLIVAIMNKRLTLIINACFGSQIKIMENKEYQFCLRCGRKLKNTEYRKIGMGKVCQEKSKTDQKVQPLFEVKNAKCGN